MGTTPLSNPYPDIYPGATPAASRGDPRNRPAIAAEQRETSEEMEAESPAYEAEEQASGIERAIRKVHEVTPPGS